MADAILDYGDFGVIHIFLTQDVDRQGKTFITGLTVAWHAEQVRRYSEQ